MVSGDIFHRITDENGDGFSDSTFHNYQGIQNFLISGIIQKDFHLAQPDLFLGFVNMDKQIEHFTTLFIIRI